MSDVTKHFLPTNRRQDSYDHFVLATDHDAAIATLTALLSESVTLMREARDQPDDLHGPVDDKVEAYIASVKRSCRSHRRNNEQP